MKKKMIVSVLALIGLISPIVAQQKQVESASSTISWNAKKVTGEHYGKIQLKSGWIVLTMGNITGGEFVVDMTTITSEDLPAGEWNDKLIGHLKSDDFFGVDQHNTSTLVITKADGLDKDGNQKLIGGLTIKGITQMINFTAIKTATGYNTTLIVDRTKYSIKYGSGQFFEGLGDKMIYDTFTLEINLAVK